MTRPPLSIVALLGLICAWPPAAIAQESGDAADTPSEAVSLECEDEACVIRAAQSLRAAGRHEEALALLNAQLDAYPASGPIQILLGVTYLDRGEHLWAADAFGRRLDQDPTDCEARFWLAYVDVQDLALDEAVYLLDGEECAQSGPMQTRVFMLRALLARYLGEEQTAREALAQAREQDTAFETDREALAVLSRLIVPERLDELVWRVVVGAGYTTNALLGSPSDPVLASVDPASAHLQTDAWARLAPDLDRPFRPAVEAQVKVLRFLAEAVRDYSYLDLTGRVGFFLDWGLPRLLLGYRPEYLLLSGGDEMAAGSVWFFSAHRGELEAELTPWLMLFAGAGRRDFRQLGRSRTEVDGGAGGHVMLIDRLALLWAAAGRAYWAREPAYDLVGASAIANLQYPLPHGASARAGVTLAADWYPDSAHFFADDARQDTFIRVGASLWSPSVAGLQVGLAYDFSDRDSSAPDYAFRDHRLTLRLSWSGALDFGLPEAAPEPPLAEVDWGLRASAHGTGERIQDLLRQDEQIRQSCGCVE
jgi:tetratricopeptide (TPR) repeat protein